MVKSYKWYDALQYAVLWLTIAAIVVNWRAGLWMTLLLALVTVAKVVAQRRLGNPALGRALRWVLAGPIAYWLVLALSMAWTSDLPTGMEVLRLKSVMLVVPLCILLSDTSYMHENHLRGLGYALLSALCAAFFYFAVKAGMAMRQGMSLGEFQNAFYGSREAGEVYHHAYIALYAVVAMVFVYSELSSHWKTMRPWHRCLLIVSLLLLICYVVVVNSRAGMLAMGLAMLACVAHFAVTRRSWKLGLGIAALAVVGIVAATQLVPGYSDRISSTLENVEADARTSINRCNWHACVKSPLSGYGVGDYHAVQVAQYTEDGFDYGVKAGFNAHNQYMESLLAAGIPGLAGLLFFLLAPLTAALRRGRRRFLVAILVVVVAFNLLFESMLERQMGLQFISMVYGIMVLIMSVEENKFARSAKS